MKVFYTGIFTLFLIVFFSVATMAQRSSGLMIDGTVTVEEGTPENAIIEITEDGKRAPDYGIPSNGRFKVELQYNHKFELLFKRDGNFQQKIIVETFVPKEVLNSNPRFPAFPVNVKLFTEIPGIDKSFSENTVLKIFYSPSVDNFVKELYYNDAQIKKLIDQAIAQGQIVDKRADFMEKLTRAELAELRKEYNELLEQAGKEYSNEEFLAALDGYKAASNIFPSEQFPKDRIAEINDLLGLIMAAEELDKAMLERFNKLVKEGDLHLGKRQLSEAKRSYDRALSIKPFDQYVNDQLKKIDSLLDQQRMEEEYRDLIAKGDQMFNELLYNEAIGLFNDALKIRPDEQYPKNKIDEINGLLAEQRKNQEKQKSYEAAMMEGERMFTKQFYDRALTSFENALNFKPEDIKAKERIADTKKVMQDVLDKIAFDKFITVADKAYKRKDYTEALSNYEQALELIPDEPRTKKRVEEISQILYAENSFNEYVGQADRQFEAQQYANAKNLYEKALNLKAEDKYATERIAEIDRILAQQSLDEQYNQILVQADNLFSNKNYENARGKYNEALGVKPKEKYPKEKLAEISTILANLAKLDRQYNDAIAGADRLFQQKRYPDAKIGYTEAGKLKPEETYPTEMIAKIDGLIAEQERLAREAAEAEAARLAAIQAEKDKNYNDAIARADAQFDAKEYETARTEYRTALDVKPEETYPQQRIDEIGTILAQLSAAQKAYEEAVALGDSEFRNENWDAAVAAYNEAKQAKADEVYPDEQLAKIDSIVTTRERLAREAAEAEAARLAAIQAEKDKNYNDAIARADAQFDAKEYETARTEYRTALDVKPEETYPQQRIDEIGTILAQLSAAQKAYEEAVARGDSEFRKENWETAITAYNEAKQAKADEAYPDEQLAKIDSIVTTRERLAREAAEAEAARLAAIQTEKDKNYNDAIARADAQFDAKEYETARTEYRTALDVKPEETYPQQRIDEIGTILAQLSAAQKAYEEAVARGDSEFRKENWETAITAYNEAKQAKADEAYPDEQLAKIDSIVTTRERLAREAAEAEAARLAAIQAEKDKNYNDAIARADAQFDAKEYETARTEYRTALDVKPEETYPQQRIDEIGTILAQLSAAQKAYEEAVARGDSEFRNENWDAAVAAYNEAKQAKTDEVYPDEQLAKIDSIITTRERLTREAAEAEAARLAALEKEREEKFTRTVERGDSLLNINEFNMARSEYEVALTFKPDDAYVKQRIGEINAWVKLQKELQEKYEAAVARGDSEFRKESWETAITAYNEAKQAKADEAYPDEQLAKIDSIVTTRERLAREAAEAEAARLAAIQAEKDKNYNDAIARADAQFDAKEYETARTEYRTALDVKPEETYPQQRIDEIGTILAQLSAAQKAYEEAVARGDSEFRKENWETAITAYNEAKQAKADEAYPDEQLAKIDSIVTTRERLAREAAEAEAARLAAIQTEKDKNYNDAIARADAQFDAKEYETARTEYRTALDVKPEETYPQQRIDEIGTILAQLSAAQKAYEEAVARGDSEFRKENWETAITAYNEAKQAKADEAYPDEQLAKIDSIVTTRERLAREAAEAEAARLAAIQAEKDKNYNDAIARADAQFDAKEYETARTEYRTALDVKPEETYPQQRIDEIGTILAQLSAAQKAYEEAVARGDSEFRKENWETAITAYNEAKQAKADEVYPDEQLAKIDSIVTTRERLAREAAEAEAARLAAIQAEKDKNYNDAIARADAQFDAKEYETARNEYRTALDVKPEETYPQQRIEEIERIIREIAAAEAEQAEINKKYTSLILQADRYFKALNYVSAKDNYLQASELKPEENYPKERLKEIEDFFTQQAVDEKYRSVIVVADGHFKTENYSDARLQYEIALGVKPEEQYPKSQIMKIDEIQEKERQRLAAEQEAAEDLEHRKDQIAQMQEELDEQRILEESGLDALYGEIIKKADAFFNDKQYNVSRAWFYKARDLKPEESYPPQRIDEINRILQGLMMSQRDREYQRFVDLGDENIRNNELAVARAWYNQALGQKPNEQYPKDQIAEIQRRVAERVAGKSQQQFEQYKATADKAYEAKNYNVARFWYRKALELRSDNEDVKAKLQEISR